MPPPLNVPGGARAAESSYRGSPAPPAQPAPAGEYYEDVDPRFANPLTSTAPAPVTHTSTSAAQPVAPPVQSTDSYEDIRDMQGARSPAESDKSNFTSISQRGINPRWNPPPPFPAAASGYGPVPRRPVPPSTNDVVLNSNPDFELPQTRVSPPRMGAGMIPGSSYPAPM
jgi:hypothetical protein